MAKEELDKVVEFANQILRSAGLDLEASAQASEAGDVVQVHGEDVALLLGHNAELLDALEYLSNRAFVRHANEENYIAFDSGNYRARREKELRLMAEKAAEKVRGSRVAFTFDPMTPNERRIIHLVLGEDKTVRTESQGNGENRRVIIHPA